MPSLPAATLSLMNCVGSVERSRSASSTFWISRVRSTPTRSVCSIGPSTAIRAPKPLLTTSSMVSASQTPEAISAMASRLSACCSRLPTKPGMSFFTCTGFRPASRSSVMVLATVASLVFSFCVTSTSGTRCGGFQKCVPTTRSRCLSFSPIRVEGMAELLLARMVVGAVRFSSSAKICCFSGSFSGAASNTKATSCIAGAICSCADMRPSTAASPPSSARALSRRSFKDCRHWADGSQMRTLWPAAARR
jgi:hypothetical protein